MVNEYPGIFHVEFTFEEVNKEIEKITKHDKRIRDVEEKLLTSVSMEPFTNYEGIENYKTISAVQKIVLYQKAIGDTKGRNVFLTAKHKRTIGKML